MKTALRIVSAVLFGATALFALSPVDVRGDATPEDVLSSPSDVKGYCGESFVRDVYSKTNRPDLLGKWNPNETGPDCVYELVEGKGGSLEIHEVKAYEDWAGPKALRTKIQETGVDQLSDDWIRAWGKRVQGTGDEVLARRVIDAMDQGKLTRIYDEVKLSTGEWRSHVARPRGTDRVLLEARAGPLKIERFYARYEEHCAKLSLLKADPHNARRLLFPNSRIMPLNSEPTSLDGFLKEVESRGHKGAVARPGLLLPDGRLIVSLKAGAVQGAMVFAFDAGTASYEYLRGDILRPEFDRKVCDAAIKGVGVGGATAVVVFLAGTGGPGGWVLLGVGIGSYMICDAAIAEWHERRDAHFVSMEDLRRLGLDVEAVLELKGDSVLAPPRGGALDVGRDLDNPLKR